MKKAVVAILILAAIAFSYVLGRGRTQRDRKTSLERKVLYYVDPMHPAYKSDKPGIAPDCGMQLEPVYADDGGTPRATTGHKILYYRADKPGLNPETGNKLEPVFAESGQSSVPPGAIKISPERQQIIGVKFA